MRSYTKTNALLPLLLRKINYICILRGHGGGSLLENEGCQLYEQFTAVYRCYT